MKYTLLDMTQKILSSMDSDEVNDINDTVESQQVVSIIQTCFDEIISRLDLPENFTLFELNASGNSAQPTVMYLPSDIDTLLWIKYNKSTLTLTQPDWRPVYYKPLEEFLDLVIQLDTTQSNVFSYTVQRGSTDTIELYGTKDMAPSYYTSFDDHTILFDSYDATVDTTLQKNKTTCYGQKITTFVASNSFVFPIDSDQYTILFNEAKALAFAELKQTQHVKAEKKARYGYIYAQKNKRNLPNKIPFFQTTPNYGRK